MKKLKSVYVCLDCEQNKLTMKDITVRTRSEKKYKGGKAKAPKAPTSFGKKRFNTVVADVGKKP